MSAQIPVRYRFMKSPYSSPLCKILPVVFVMFISFAIMPLKGGAGEYFYGIINERGPLPYFILYVFFMNAVAFVIALFRKILPVNFKKEFLVYSFFPLGFGIIGAILGLGSVLAGIASLFYVKGLQEVKGAITEMTVGMGVGCDTLLLGVVYSMICFSCYTFIIGWDKLEETL